MGPHAAGRMVPVQHKDYVMFRRMLREFFVTRV